MLVPDDQFEDMTTIGEGMHAGFQFVVLALASSIHLGFLAVLFGWLRFHSYAHSILWIYAIANGLGFVVIPCHKAFEISLKSRIDDSLLHLIEGFGGFAGSFLGQHLFRHRIRSGGYQYVFWSIAAIHIGFWIWWFHSGVDWFNERIR